MKRIIVLMSALALVLTACTGDPGPPGPPGPPGFDGQDGFNFVGQSFETEPLNFTSANGYEEIINFPESITILQDDMILVYLLWAENPDTWRLLPQTIYAPTGEFQYNFQDNFDNVSIFLDAPNDLNLESLDPIYTQDQYFRVVVLPVDLANSIDVTNANEVFQYIK